MSGEDEATCLYFSKKAKINIGPATAISGKLY
jgi:hypothetical protein